MSRAIRANRDQAFLLPPNIDEWVGPGHPVRFVADLVETLDLAKLGFRMSPGDEGRPHFAAELLLGVWLYGWMDRIRSTRALEKAVQTQIPFLWLAGMERPDHVTLWRFFNDNRKALKTLFKVVVRAAADAGLVGYALHALDGTKLSGAGSMDSALHRKTLDEELKKLDELIDRGMADVDANEAQATDEWLMPKSLEDAKTRKEEIKAALQRLDEADTNHLHPKEPEARAVKTREGVKLGYNAQAVVDHESDLIVAADVVNEAVDNAQLVPMVEQVAETLGKPAEQTVADTGYASGAQLAEAERRHLPVLVPPHAEKSAKGDYAKSKFSFDAERDEYVCPRGEHLPFAKIVKATTGKPEMRIYRCENTSCPVRGDCTKEDRRTIKRYKDEAATVRQAELLKLPRNAILYSLRKEIIEHAFGIVKWIDGFRRFTAWGLEGAKAQWSLACLAVNLRKLLPAYRDGRLAMTAFGG